MSFDAGLLKAAVEATFARRETEMPVEAPLALTDTFANDPSKQMQWKAFIRKSGLEFVEFAEVIAEIRSFIAPLLMPPSGAESHATWLPDEHRWEMSEG